MDRFIARENIKHFKLLLEGETDPGRRVQLLRMLADEEARLKKAEVDAKAKANPPEGVAAKISEKRG